MLQEKIKRIIEVLMYIVILPLVLLSCVTFPIMALVAVIKYIIYGTSKGDPKELIFVGLDYSFKLHMKINEKLKL